MAANLRNAFEADEDKTELDTLARNWAKELLLNATTKLKKGLRPSKQTQNQEEKAPNPAENTLLPALLSFC